MPTRLRLVFPLAALLAATAAAPAAAGPVGVRTLDLAGREPGRRLETVVVYPAAPGGTATLLGDNRVIVGERVQRDAPLAAGPHPVVLLSHGSGGNAAGLAWLSTRLAANGYIVIGPNHPGTTSGDSSEKATVEIWRRPPDLLAALDGLRADAAFAPVIDADRIAALGFSLGGYDVLALAGARQDRRAFANYCDRNRRMAGCDWLRRGGVDFAALDPRVDTDLRDSRVKAVVAVDPAFTPSFTEESLRAVSIPVAIVNLGTPATTPGIVEGRFVADTIPGARLTRVPDAVHLSFLGLCKPGAAELLAAAADDPVCDDAPGARPRAELHDAIAAPILNALATFLPAKSAP